MHLHDDDDDDSISWKWPSASKVQNPVYFHIGHVAAESNYAACRAWDRKRWYIFTNCSVALPVCVVPYVCLPAVAAADLVVWSHVLMNSPSHDCDDNCVLFPGFSSTCCESTADEIVIWQCLRVFTWPVLNKHHFISGSVWSSSRNPKKPWAPKEFVTTDMNVRCSKFTWISKVCSKFFDLDCFSGNQSSRILIGSCH